MIKVNTAVIDLYHYHYCNMLLTIQTLSVRPITLLMTNF